MTAKIFIDVLERVETWPQEAQEELAATALVMDAGPWWRRVSPDTTSDAGLLAYQRLRHDPAINSLFL